MTNASPMQNATNQLPAANGLAIVRVTVGAMLVWVFFENLGKGLYTPAGYAGLINYYIKASHSPAAWKAVMGLAASHAAMAGSYAGVDRDLARHPARHRSADAPGRLGSVSISRQPLGVGVGHGVDLGASGSGNGIAWTRGRAGGSSVGRRRLPGAALAVFSVVVTSAW